MHILHDCQAPSCMRLTTLHSWQPCGANACSAPLLFQGRQCTAHPATPPSCCRVTRVLWPPSRWGPLPPQPSLTRVVGKGGTLEFLQPPSREQDWWS